MALGFQTNAFQGPGFQGGTPAAVVVGGGGDHGQHQGRRTRYHIRNLPERLTDDELEALLKRVLEDEPAPTAKALKRFVATADPAEKFAAQARPAFVPLRDRLLERKEYEAALMLQRIVTAIALAEDEREVEMLLLQ